MSKKQLTPPFDGAVDLPVREGWYPCMVKGGVFDGSPPEAWPRRYWDGLRFSDPVALGALDHQERDARRYHGFFENRRFFWCGLTAPAEGNP